MSRRRKYPDPSKGDVDMMSLVLEVDRDWAQYAYYPKNYQFSNGRVFGEPSFPGEEYDWFGVVFRSGIQLEGLSDRFEATEDGRIIQVQGV